MQTRPQSWLYLAACAALGAGCSTMSAGDDPRAARLPTGITLLESDRQRCDGRVAINARSIAGSRGTDLVVQRGQNATFEVEADRGRDVEIEWACVGTAAADRERTECPDATTHVRITRAADDDVFLLECYGDRDDRFARRDRR